MKSKQVNAMITRAAKARRATTDPILWARLDRAVKTLTGILLDGRA